MAKGIFDQIIGFLSNKTFDSSERYDESIYITDSGDSISVVTTRTRVEEYIARQTEADIQNNATGVARYLAKKAKEEQLNQARQKNELTGVARYLAKQAKSSAPKPQVAVAKTTGSKQKTGVEKYLAKQKESKPAPAIKAETKSSQRTAPATKENKPATKPKAAPKKAEKQPEPAIKEKPKTAELTDLSGQDGQCQAATNSGSRCKRNTNITSIQRTIQNQKYQFAVCSQHKNNKAFKPYPGLIEK